MRDLWTWPGDTETMRRDSGRAGAGRETTTTAFDLVGYDVEAVDGSIGKIDEATYDAGQSSLVVDTGWWIFGKKRIIPAGLVSRVDPGEQKVYLDCSKDDVKNAPDYEAQTWTDTSRTGVTDYYGRFIV